MTNLRGKCIHQWPSPTAGLPAVCNYLDSSGRENICPRFRSMEKSWLRLILKAVKTVCDALLKGYRESSTQAKPEQVITKDQRWQ